MWEALKKKKKGVWLSHADGWRPERVQPADVTASPVGQRHGI